MVSYISEIKLKQGLRKVSAISVISLLLLSLFAFATFKVVSYVYNSSNSSELEAAISEYAITIKRKAQGEMRALRTLAMFTTKSDDITKTYSAVGTDNIPFEVVGFWNLDGSCEQVSISGVRTDSHYMNLPSQVKVAISSAWLGRSAVSAPYYSPTIGSDILTYVAPVHATSGNVMGALSGVVSQNSFDNTLEQLSMVNQGLDTFLCTASGYIFSRGVNGTLPRDTKYITDFKAFEGRTKDQIKAGLASKNPVHIETTINDKSFLITLTPLGFSDWYIGTISSNEFTQSPYFKSIMILIISLVVIFTLCAFIAIYLFISMKSSYKTQLLIAHYDPVTSAYNYQKFLLEFSNIDYRTNTTSSYSVVSLNIHDFSYIQDVLGEAQTDELLRIIARELREQDSVMMFCHHELDQFILMLRLRDQAEVDAEVRRIMDLCCRHINIEVSTIPIVMYAGVAFTYPDLTPEKIVSRADFAKKQVSKSYTHAVRFYDENAYKKEAFLHSIEKSMRNALKNEEFKLFLQPKIDLSTGKVYAAEALVRWISDSDVIVYPNDFIPLFEQNGFCTELDLYMFDKACARIRYYLDNGVEPIYYSINQTKLLIFQKGYTDKLRAIINKYNIPPKYLVIEVLEDLATHNVNELNNRINELKTLGLSIALDDFGSGYSSLNIVAGLDIDEIKFDREFLLAEDPEQIKKNHMILRVLSKLAKELGIRTVVEGVERNEDVEFLKSIDCDLAQGYYYDRPIPVEAFDKKYIFTDCDEIPPVKPLQASADTPATADSTSATAAADSDASAAAAANAAVPAAQPEAQESAQEPPQEQSSGK